MSDIVNFSERLKIAMKNFKMTQEELAQKIGLSRGAINNVMRKKNFLEFNSAAKAAKILGVSLDWLAYGDGPAPTADADEISLLDRIESRHNEEAHKEILYLLDLVKELDKSAQTEIYELILHHARGAIKVVINKRTKEYTRTAEPLTPGASISS